MNKQKGNPKQNKKKNCVICDKHFGSYKGIQKICSPKCRKELNKVNFGKFNNKESTKKYKKKWWLEHRTQQQKRKRAYYKRNRDEILQKRQTPEHQKKAKQWRKKYAKKPETKQTHKFHKHKRRAKIKQLKFNLTKKDFIKIKKKYTSCVYCKGKEKLQYEHIIPVAKNGTYTMKNIIIACHKCNISKQAQHLLDWLKKSYCKAKNIKEQEVLQRIREGC